MTVLLDNLIAIVVGSTLLVALLVVQQRGQQSAIDATARYQARALTAQFVDVLERDVENIRTMEEMEAAFGARRFTLRQNGAHGYTYQFAFPTLLDPGAGIDSEVALVTYEVRPTGRTLQTPDGARPVYRATRYVYTQGADDHVVSGGSGPLLDFDVELFDATGAPVHGEEIAETPPEVVFSVVAASEGPARRASDQAATGSTLTRLARTVRVQSAWATGAPPPAASPALAGIPALPGDPGAMAHQTSPASD